MGPTGALGIRKPLSSINSVSAEDARSIVWERLNGPFLSVENFCSRLCLSKDTLEALAKAGALDSVSQDSRTALWEVGVFLNKTALLQSARDQERLFAIPFVTARDVPELPELTNEERLSWDLLTHNAARQHPLSLLRHSLQELEIRPVETCYRVADAVGRTIEPNDTLTITTAGIVILRQRPPTAKGFMFITIEDETGFIQCVVPPSAQNRLDHVLTASALIVRGALQATGNWRGMVLDHAWVLDGIFGGYEGFAGTYGGRDHWVRGVATSATTNG